MAVLRRAAEKGHPFAQGQLATLTRDKEALEWAQRAARNHDREGLWKLGDCFEHGRGVTQDLTRAAAAYKESAELGYSDGMVSYAKIAS